MTEHTPGPWELDALGSDGAFEIWNTPLGAHDTAAGFVICGRNPIEHRAEASRANARLIAAAPELLAALKAADHTLSVHGHIDADTELHETIQRLIRKATEPRPTTTGEVK